MPPPWTPPSTPSRVFFNAAGLYVFAALLLGGGTRAGTVSDFLLQLLTLPMLWHLVREFPGAASWPVRLLVILPLVVAGWQLLPWWDGQGVYFPNTRDPYLTLQALLNLLVVLSFFWWVHVRQPPRQVVAGWLLLGVGVHILIYLLVMASGASGLTIFSWKMHAGLMANENHLSLLLVVAVPLLMAWLRQAGWPWLVVPVVGILLLFQLVIGSRAGVAFIVVTALLSWILVLQASRRLMLAGLLLVAGVGWLLLPALPVWVNDVMDLSGGASRAAIWRNTWEALRDHWPWGSGLGTFVPVYAGYERAGDIVDVYINRAHSDWLELLLEAGMAGVVLMVVLPLLVAWQVWHARPLGVWQRAALLGLVFILLHSLVDYPLRTLAVGVVFAWLLAVVLPAPASGRGSSGREVMNGDLDFPLPGAAPGEGAGRDRHRRGR